MIVATDYTTKIPKRYDALTRVAHWVAAVLIIYTMIAGYSLHFLVGTPYFSFFFDTQYVDRYLSCADHAISLYLEIFSRGSTLSR